MKAILFRLAFAVLTIGLIFQPAHADEQSARGQGKARLAVLPAVFAPHFKPEIRFSETVESTGRIDFKMIFSTEYESRMTNPSFTLSMVEAFVNSRKFDVLERSRLNEALKEVDFGQSDYADVGKVVPMGQALNAEYVVLPEIIVIHMVEDAHEIPYVDKTQLLLKGKMIVRMRVVDTAGTRVVAAGTEEVQVERRLQANNPFLSTEVHNLIVDLYRGASVRLLQRTLEAVYPVRILDSDGMKVVLNRGEGAISVGDEFDVFELGRAYVDPDTRETLGRREDHVALIRVNRVTPKFSEAEILKGTDALGGDASRFLCRETKQSVSRKTAVSSTQLQW